MSEKTPVSVLQEFCMQQKVAPPTYDINETKTKEFVCVVSAFNNCAEATARSKIEAKQASCTSLLLILKEVEQLKSKLNDVCGNTSGTSTVGLLITLCLHRKIEEPIFEEEIGGVPHIRQFTVVCHVDGKKFIGRESTKKGAKEQAASAAYNELKDADTPLPKHQNNPNHTGALITMCRERSLPPPKFAERSVNDGQQKPCFQYWCSVGNKECSGEALKKKVAKETAAKKMIDILVEANDKTNISMNSNSGSDYFSNTSLNSTNTDDSTNLSLDSSILSESSEDYISELYIYCSQNNYQVEFEQVDFPDALFTFSCRVGDRLSDGTAGKKKHAKNLAAKAMLEIIRSEPQKSLDPIVLPTLEEVMAQYARMKQNNDYAPAKQTGVRAAHNPFSNVSAIERARAVQILTSDHFSARNKIDSVCKALSVDYEFKHVPKHLHNMRAFMLTNCTHDCVLIDEQHVLDDRVLEYMKTMLNVNKMPLTP